ncbi:unnamed protein product [Cyprideis torosa]|uniref:Uncharacterized protein n=1 Tax=Cyprideis torosa TaxID=163714 RepID=A0A7R8W6H5_9CRUS|nr:unnamed protein product [Cyprideis torosa]CAG0886438.1 unnamed protein product [Cyprideis torosa]
MEVPQIQREMKAAIFEHHNVHHKLLEDPENDALKKELKKIERVILRLNARQLIIMEKFRRRLDPGSSPSSVAPQIPTPSPTRQSPDTTVTTSPPPPLGVSSTYPRFVASLNGESSRDSSVTPPSNSEDAPLLPKRTYLSPKRKGKFYLKKLSFNIHASDYSTPIPSPPPESDEKPLFGLPLPEDPELARKHCFLRYLGLISVSEAENIKSQRPERRRRRVKKNPNFIYGHFQVTSLSTSSSAKSASIIPPPPPPLPPVAPVNITTSSSPSSSLGENPTGSTSPSSSSDGMSLAPPPQPDPPSSTTESSSTALPSASTRAEEALGVGKRKRKELHPFTFPDPPGSSSSSSSYGKNPERRKSSELGQIGQDGHEEVCAKCREGGMLILCDTINCEASYHLSCVDLKSCPKGNWYCPQCTANRKNGVLLTQQNWPRTVPRKRGRGRPPKSSYVNGNLEGVPSLSANSSSMSEQPNKRKKKRMQALWTPKRQK